jgi:hypothetical protein
MTMRSYAVGLAALALGISACSSGGSKHSSSTTTSVAPTTTDAEPTTTVSSTRLTRDTIPTSSGYFEVAQVIGRTSSAGRCHTLPTTLDCLTLGKTLGATQDLVDSGQPHINSYGDWLIDTRISQKLVDNINRNLHRPLAFIVDGAVPEIISFDGPVHPDAAGIFNVGPEQAVAVKLANNLRSLQTPQP